jgi:hypothetical protein
LGVSFITFITPHYKRPKALAECIASVGRQTLASEVEHIVLPDYVGRGIGGMYGELPKYASTVHGDYVHLLADDDVLVGHRAVQDVKDFAELHGYPAMIVVKVIKYTEMGPLQLPRPGLVEPVMGQIDLGCLITRSDVWKQHCHQYGNRYEGDFDYAAAVWNAGHKFLYADVFFLEGAVMRGRPEAA